MTDITQRTRDLLARQLAVGSETITDNWRPTVEGGADMLDSLEIVMELEEQFGIEINDEDAETLGKERTTFATIVEYVEQRLRQNVEKCS